MPACMRTLIKLIICCILALPVAAFPAEKKLNVKGVRYSTYASFTRIVFEIEAITPYVFTRTADNRGLMLTAYDGTFSVQAALPSIRDGVVSGLELREEAGKNYLVVRLDNSAGETKDFVLRGPDRIVLDITRGRAPVSPPQPLDKQLVIMIDPGHGGKDTGIVTAQGNEKTATLDIALAVRKVLQKDPRMHVLLTREQDQPLSIEDRAAISNAAGATLFVSIHAGPGTDPRVFIQDLSEDAGASAVQPVSGDFLGFEAGSEQQEMIWGKQQALHTRESGGLGRKLAHQLTGRDGAEPVQAPLVGLKAVDAAAVVVEIGMLQERMQTGEAIAGGIERYVGENR